ncbi:ferroxidase fet3 [Coemansia erecta]|uniref:Ferroxidase fet3 n=1 Tax=Coemansia erecta TaxID=147472 RepID=A0A9W7Y0R6_9FUNG|nr:ferroxidase fet3 [Coemansia erecta]
MILYRDGYTPPIALIFFACACFAKQVHVSWDVGYVSVNRVNQNTFNAIGVNGRLPIPPVYATVGDTLVLDVYNSLNVTTTIHAHGISQNGTSYMDGPAMVTQCGIPPGGSFTYRFNLMQAGTYWLHGHDRHQNADGLRTPLVIYDRHNPYDYDDEHMFVFEDWYTNSFEYQLNRTLDITQPPPPRSNGFGLINGFNGNDTAPISFEPGKTYRIRLINMSTNQWFQFALPGHRMFIIETDGEYTERTEADGIELSPAQRYSVLVTAHDSDRFNYQYKVTMNTDLNAPVPGSVIPVYHGLVEYHRDSPLRAANEFAQKITFVNDIAINSLKMEPPLPVDRSISVALGNSLFSTGQRLFHFDGIVYSPPKVPSLFTALTMGNQAMDPRVYGPQTHAIVLNHLEVVEFTVHNPTSQAHPIHFHGRSFQVYGFGPADNDPLANTTIAPVIYNNVAPLRRDIVVIPGHHHARIRFRADNPGVWLMHCHIDLHSAMGMVLTIVEAPDVLQRRNNIPEDVVQLCQSQNIPTEGNAAGNWGLDMTGLPTPPTLA